jgi:glycosyltransferase involved in cell wall biosynthesis
LNVLLLEPYYGGSHRAWVDGYRQHAQHAIHLLTLPAQYWKWRLQGGAVTLARLFDEQNVSADVILASDMLDLSTFRALTRARTTATPIALYFHENQLTYPQNARQHHGYQYGFINYTSALVADAVYFNSRFHHDAFLDELPRMLKHFADFNELQTVDAIRQRASVLPLGLDLRRYDAYRVEKSAGEPPLILWNHRWEDDKNPQAFFAALYGLLNRDVPFRVALVGENFRQDPVEFRQARDKLGARVTHYGYLQRFADYARLLWQADYVVSTAYQDFFGIAVAEAIYCGCVPLLPDRLNYPALIPPELHTRCLFPGHDLLPLLLQHIGGELRLNEDALAALQKNVAQYDWATMSSVYDAALAALVKA